MYSTAVPAERKASGWVIPSMASPGSDTTLMITAWLIRFLQVRATWEIILGLLVALLGLQLSVAGISFQNDHRIRVMVQRGTGAVNHGIGPCCFTRRFNMDARSAGDHFAKSDGIAWRDDALTPMVLLIDGGLKMWFNGKNSTEYRIGLAERRHGLSTSMRLGRRGRRRGGDAGGGGTGYIGFAAFGAVQARSIRLERHDDLRCGGNVCGERGVSISLCR
jgi:hypothetical protein